MAEEHQHGGAVTAPEDEIAKAAEQGAADASAGQPMRMRYWHAEDAIKDAYASAYQAVVDPPKIKRASTRVSAKAPKPPKGSLRVWKQPPSS